MSQLNAFYDQFSSGVSHLNSSLPSFETVHNKVTNTLQASLKNLPKLEEIKAPEFKLPFFEYPKYDKEIFDDKYVYTFDVPGYKLENISMIEKNGYVSIKGSKITPALETKPLYRSIERHSGDFSRSFFLDAEIAPFFDWNTITTLMEDGVLTIIIPKVKNESPKTDILIPDLTTDNTPLI